MRARGERLERVRAPQRRCDVPSAVADAAIAIQDGKKIRTEQRLEIELVSYRDGLKVKKCSSSYSQNL